MHTHPNHSFRQDVKKNSSDDILYWVQFSLKGDEGFPKSCSERVFAANQVEAMEVIRSQYPNMELNFYKVEPSDTEKAQKKKTPAQYVVVGITLIVFLQMILGQLYG